MTNKFRPHVLIFPEDDANRQIANGFLMRLPPDRLRRVQVLNPVGGWFPVRKALILGTQSHPEELKKDLGSFETIGKALAQDCMNDTIDTWKHPLLSHNVEEVARMQADVTAILFGRGA